MHKGGRAARTSDAAAQHFPPLQPSALGLLGVASAGCNAGSALAKPFCGTDSHNTCFSVPPSPPPCLPPLGPAGEILYWDLVETHVAKRFKAHRGAVCSLAMHPAGGCLLTASIDGVVRVWT